MSKESVNERFNDKLREFMGTVDTTVQKFKEELFRLQGEYRAEERLEAEAQVETEAEVAEGGTED